MPLRCAAKPEVGLYWHELLRNSGAEVDPFAPIMRLLGRTNPFILEKAALVLGRILSLKVHTLGVEVEEVTESDEVTQRHLLTFTEWIFHQLNSAHSLEISQVRAAPANCGAVHLAVHTRWHSATCCCLVCRARPWWRCTATCRPVAQVRRQARGMLGSGTDVQ